MHNKCGPWTFIHLCVLIHAKHNILQFIHLQASAEAVRLYNLHTESLFLLSSWTTSARGCALVENKVLVVSSELGSLWVREKSPLSLRYALSASHEAHRSLCMLLVVQVVWARAGKKSARSSFFLSFVKKQEICVICIESRAGTEQLKNLMFWHYCACNLLLSYSLG